ncbi:MAG: hypothetical protein P8Y25_02725 [Chromatiaceae bacterium]
MAFSDDGQPVMNSMLMRRALEYARTFNVPLIAHDRRLAPSRCRRPSLV